MLCHSGIKGGTFFRVHGGERRKHLFPPVITYWRVECGEDKDNTLGDHSNKEHFIAEGEVEQFKHRTEYHDGSTEAVGEVDEPFSPFGLQELLKSVFISFVGVHFFNYQLPITNYQLSIINYQLSITNYNYRLLITNEWELYKS
jgi:hypothetical protein